MEHKFKVGDIVKVVDASSSFLGKRDKGTILDFYKERLGEIGKVAILCDDSIINVTSIKDGKEIGGYFWRFKLATKTTQKQLK